MDATTANRLREIAAAEKRLAQLRRNAETKLAAEKRRNPGAIRDSNIRMATKELQAAQRNVTTFQSIKDNPNVSSSDIRQFTIQAGMSEATKKRQRQTRAGGDNASSGQAASKVSQNNFDQGFTKESSALGFSTTHQAETDRQAEASQYVKSQQVKEPPIKSDNTGSGTTTDPFKASQPDESKVSPYLKANMESNKVSFFQGPVKPSYAYSVELTEGGKKEESTIAPYGSLDFLYGEKQLSPTGKVIQPAIDYLDEYTQRKPRSYPESLLMEFTQPIAGGLKQGAALVGSLDNLGYLVDSWRTGTDQKVKDIEIKPTIDQPVIDAILTGKSFDQAVDSYKDYLTTYHHKSIQGELTTFAIGGKGAKNLIKVFPVRGERFGQPGIKLLQSQISKIKTPIGTPQIITKEVSAKSISLGYGSKTRPIISKVGDKINIGKPNLTNISVEANPITKKQLQRGIKMAADSSKYEQVLASRLIPKIKGITEESKVLAKTEEELIDILTKPKKDTIINPKLGEQVFENVSRTEQPSFTGALTKAQRQMIDPIGKYEGSLSGYYFTAKPYLRTLGDVDLHADTFSKAAKQMKRITPEIKADPGRKFLDAISEKNKSVKQNVFDLKTGKKEKTIEILNPEETDELGVLQSIEGDTLFGQKIPTKSYKVAEGKTYGRQRQILKKMESLYSLQKDESTGIVKLRPFEKRYKDVADTYALGRSAQQTEFVKGSKDYERLDYLLDQLKGHFKKHENFDIDEYLTKKGISDDVVLLTDKSILQKLGSSTGKSLSDSSKQIPESMQLTKQYSQLDKKEIPTLDKKPSLYNNSKINRNIQRDISMSSLTRVRDTRPIQSSLYNRGRQLTRKPTSLYNRGKPITQSPTNILKPNRYTNSPTPPKSPPVEKSLGSIKSPPRGLLQRPPTPERSLLGKSPSVNNPPYFIPKNKPFGLFPPIITKDRTSKAPGTKKPSHNFFGGTHAAQITGFRTKKKDIDVGDKKTSKLYKEDILFTKKKYRTSDKKNAFGLKSKRSLF